MGEQRGGEVDFPALRLHLDDAADDKVADFRGVARAEGADGEEFVGFEEGAGDGGEDLGGGGVRVGSVAAGGGGLAGSLKSDKVCQRGQAREEGREYGIPHPLWIIGYSFAGRDYGFGREFGAFRGWRHVGVAV